MAYSGPRSPARASWPRLAIWIVTLLPFFNAAYAFDYSNTGRPVWDVFVPLKADVVYRGEVGVTPKQVEERGGFYSLAYQREQQGYPLSNRKRRRGSNLQYHAVGNEGEVFAGRPGIYESTAEYTRYVSTSSSNEIALFHIFKNKDFKSYKSRKVGYIYKIQADERFVDVNASLQGYTRFAGELEQAAIGYIPWEQVEGWYEISYERMTDLQSGRVTVKEGEPNYPYFENPKFNPETVPKKGRGAEPGLAGFDAGHPACKYDFWGKWCDKPAADTLDKIMAEICTGGKKESACLQKMGYAGNVDSSPARGRNRQGKVDLAGTGSKPSESGPNQQPKKPSGAAEVASAKEEKVIRLAEEIGEKKFARLAERKGLVATVEDRWKTSLDKVESKALFNAGGHALTAAGIGVWTTGAVDVFTTASTDLDKAVAITAVIPFVGCGTQLVQKLHPRDLGA